MDTFNRFEDIQKSWLQAISYDNSLIREFDSTDIYERY